MELKGWRTGTGKGLPIPAIDTLELQAYLQLLEVVQGPPDI